MRSKCSKILMGITIATLVFSIVVFALSFFKDLNTMFYIFGAVQIALASFAVFVAANVGIKFSCSENMFDEITKILPGGSLKCYFDEELSIVDVSPCLISYLGFEKRDFERFSKGKLMNIIHVSDREGLDEKILKVLAKEEEYINLKLVGANDTVYTIVGFLKEKKSRYFIKSLRKSEYLLKWIFVDPRPFYLSGHIDEIDAARYKIVADQSESIIFDYNIKTEKIFFNENFEKKFGFEIGDRKLKEAILEGKLILEEDYDKIINYKHRTMPFIEEEARLRKADGEYIWCKIRMTTTYDANKNPLRIIGKIIDVNASRKERQRLIEKSNLDPMTGLYNKVSSEALIAEEVQKASLKSLNAFLLIDIDNFKMINDTCGHLKGDEILLEIALNIKNLFRSTDIVGRVGGDEFVVFLKDIPTHNHAEKKAKGIINVVQDISKAHFDSLNISVSIGISFNPDQGNTYTDLFNKSDISLYNVKQLGKNSFAVYDDTMTIVPTGKTQR